MAAAIEILVGRNPANPLAGYVTELLAIERYTYRLVDAPSGSDRLRWQFCNGPHQFHPREQQLALAFFREFLLTQRRGWD